MRAFIYSIIGILLSGCNSHNIHPNKAKALDTTTKTNYFENYEKEALDSVAKYKIDSAYNTCVKYLYVLYGSEFLPESRLTVGECNIKLTGFSTISDTIKSMTFGVFISDTIPTRTELKIGNGIMINSFSVNIQNHKIIMITAGTGEIKIANVQALYDSAKNSTSFNYYLNKNRSKLHPKFIKLLDVL